MALKIPFFLFPDCFVKNETVNGIIGKTQGVNRAAKPEKNAIINIVSKLLSLDFFGFDTVVFSSFLV